MSPLIIVIAVVAGAVGAVIRYLVSRAFARRPFPWAVLIVNLAGSAIAGVVLAVAGTAAAPELQLVVLSGFAGGLTTFSTFAVESMQLNYARRLRDFIVSTAANVGGGVVACGLAWLITKALLGAL